MSGLILAGVAILVLLFLVMVMAVSMDGVLVAALIIAVIVLAARLHEADTQLTQRTTQRDDYAYQLGILLAAAPPPCRKEGRQEL
jgi:membrane protein implicated in regulation of membrane protease activity